MYADRYATGPSIKPGSLGLALAGTALPLVALVVGLQIQRVINDPTVLKTYIVPPEPIRPPDPAPPQPHTAPANHERVFTPVPIPLPSENKTDAVIDFPKMPTPPDPPIPGTGDIGKVEPIKSPPPVIVGAQIDPRYAGMLQPPYPAEEVRAGRNGRVVLRVLVGADGRVHQVERVEATSDAFFAAAERQALAKWRFTPATRDGVAIEQWKVMNLRFELHDD
jgi:periplasmic protein TonB